MGLETLPGKFKGTQPNAESPPSVTWRRVTSAFTTEEDLGAAVPDSAVPRVLKALLEKIDQGVYEPGKKINTVELARDLKLSRAPVREAIHILAGQGIISLLPDRGAVLRPFNPSRVFATLAVLEPLFCLTLQECARRINENKNAELLRQHRRIIATMDAETVDFTFYLAIHNFHYDVDRIAGNVIVNELIPKLNLDLLARTFSEYVEVRKYVEVYIQTYKRLIDALLAGDGGAAKSTFSFHVQWQVSKFKEALEELQRVQIASDSQRVRRKRRVKSKSI